MHHKIGHWRRWSRFPATILTVAVLPGSACLHPLTLLTVAVLPGSVCFSNEESVAPPVGATSKQVCRMYEITYVCTIMLYARHASSCRLSPCRLTLVGVLPGEGLPARRRHRPRRALCVGAGPVEQQTLQAAPASLKEGVGRCGEVWGGVGIGAGREGEDSQQVWTGHCTNSTKTV